MSRVILCKCANRKLVHFPDDLELKLKVFSDVVYVDDLCSSVIENPKALAEICEEDTVVLACHTRAVEALLSYAKARIPKKIFDMRSSDAKGFAQYVEAMQDAEGEANVSNIEESSNAWYPCIDYNACVNCSKCLDFCIFGVYEKVEGKVTVVAPTNCKDNCPACARTCPKGAVIFPKCPDLKISGKVEDTVESSEDFYDLLKKRRRRSILK